MKFRDEQDTMGTVQVHEGAYYGAQTQRAIENFNISPLKFPAAFIHALGMIKKHAARVNKNLGLLKPDLAEAIISASEDVIKGRLDKQFAVDVFQTGSGTSTNMNANEVIAGRANEILTGKRGGKTPVHPNDHVNMGQSSNDVIPTTIHIAAYTEIKGALVPALVQLKEALTVKSKEFEEIKKIARTHLQDAVPMTLGQEFSAYARQIELGIDRVHAMTEHLSELALGGTAVGTGLNTHPDFAKSVIEGISEETGCLFREAANHFEAQAARDALVETSAALRTLALSLTKIANDIRWLSSGPRCGIGEIRIPPLQPGSSIMPGKVNPVMPEVILQVSAQVIGNDTAVTFSVQLANFELHVGLPLIAYNILQSIALLSNAVNAFTEKCVADIEADQNKCASNLEKSLALATAFVPLIGYDKAATLAKKAFESGKTVREVAIKNKILPVSDIHKILDKMIGV